VSPPKFTPEELRGLTLLKRLPAETLDLLAARLDKLDASYHAPEPLPVERPNMDSSFLYRLRFDSHPEYGRVVGHPPAAVKKQPQHHRWHDLAWQIDDVLREISGLELGYASGGGPTPDFIAWAIKKITGETVESGTVARTLRRLREQSGQT
jgi:hypothetical protein